MTYTLGSAAPYPATKGGRRRKSRKGKSKKHRGGKTRRDRKSRRR